MHADARRAVNEWRDSFRDFLRSDLLGAAKAVVPDEVLDRLDDASAVPPGFPHELTRRPSMRKGMYGPFPALPTVAP